MVEEELHAGVSFMNEHGLLHFDAHFENILTDGERLYFTDYGLAMSSAFELSQSEAEFFDRHQSYDRSYVAAYFVNWLVTALGLCTREDSDRRYALVRGCAEGHTLPDLPAQAAAIISRHAPIAVVMSDFIRQFQRQSRRTPYPSDAVRDISAARR